MIGGGAQSSVWNQIKADVLGVPFRRVMRAESATWGSALIAGKACGAITDLAEAALTGSPVQQSCHQPEPLLREPYDRAISRYLEWQRVLEKGFKQYD